MASVLQADDVVRVHNNMQTDWIGQWNSKTYRAKSGRDAFVPFSLVKKDFGDPRSRLDKVKVSIDANTVEYIASRHDELTRLATLYGAHDNPGDYGYIKSMMPDVSVFNLEGDPLTFPCDDPECRMALGLAEEDESRNEMLLREMADMKRRLLIYEQMLASDTDTSSVEIDAPEQTPQELHVEDFDESTFEVDSVAEDGAGGIPTPKPKVRVPVMAVRE